MKRLKVAHMPVSEHDFGTLLGEITYSIDVVVFMYLALSLNKFLTNKLKLGTKFYIFSFAASFFCVKEFKAFYLLLYFGIAVNTILREKKITAILQEAIIFSNSLVIGKIANKVFFNTNKAYFTFLTAMAFFCFYSVRIKKHKEVEFEIYEIKNEKTQNQKILKKAA